MGREFLQLARELLAFGKSARHWRGAVIHAYYAVLLECRDIMARWGLPAPPRQQVHAKVRLRLVYATNPDLKRIGYALDDLSRDRNAANYDSTALSIFASPALAQTNTDKAADALALLDAIDADPARRTAAAASIRP